jgi:D-sedoheptulose 7-phosphate isomerase
MEARTRELLAEAKAVQQELAEAEDVHRAVAASARAIIDSLRAGGRVLLCGNGGSAADSQHIAGELVGRYLRERPGVSAIALTTDTSVITAVANDYGYEEVFSRQVEALGREGDVLVAISTSGNAETVLRAVEEAKGRGMRTIGMTGSEGGRLAEIVEIAVCVPASTTPRVQECHGVLGHVLCEIVEAALTGPEEKK